MAAPAFKCNPGDKIKISDILAYLATFRDGIDGNDGTNGVSIIDIKYDYLTDKIIVEDSSGAKYSVPSFKGNDGADGASINLRGPISFNDLISSSGIDGDVYVLLSSGVTSDGTFLEEGDSVYYSHSKWNYLGRLQGADSIVPGPKGDTGLTGPVSTVVGPRGHSGLRGPLGHTGPVGIQGPNGIAGLQGIQGFVGPQGHYGHDGIQGIQGLIGLVGPKGIQGHEGPKGPSGSGINFLGVKDTVDRIRLITGHEVGDVWMALNTSNLWIFDNPFPPHDLAGADWHELGHVRGPTGPDGPRGIQGLIGPHGLIGGAGPTGNQGIPGIQGITGAKGNPGHIGDQGIQGVQGSAGHNGHDGVDGTGVTIQGSNTVVNILNEDSSNTGLMWIAEDTGSDDDNNVVNIGDGLVSDGSKWINVGPIRGPRGYTGPNGVQGVQGIDGPRGEIGHTGAQGNDGGIGLTGAHGSTGPAGHTGHKGDKGEMGHSIHFSQAYQDIQHLLASEPTPEVGDTHLTVDTGDLWTYNHMLSGGVQGWHDIGHVQGPVGNDGQKGDPGHIGVDGPQGNQGIQGPDGHDGLDGADSTVVGPQGTTGLRGLQGIKGDRGIQGDDSVIAGPQGEKGDDGPIGISGDKGDRGHKGDRGDRGFSITGPRGPIGITGDRGPKGDNGIQGPAGTCDIATVDEVEESLINTKAITPLTLDRKSLVESKPVDAKEHKVPNIVYATEADYSLITKVVDTLYILTED